METKTDSKNHSHHLLKVHLAEKKIALSEDNMRLMCTSAQLMVWYNNAVGHAILSSNYIG